jgi:hypothetical protein
MREGKHFISTERGQSMLQRNNGELRDRDSGTMSHTWDVLAWAARK